MRGTNLTSPACDARPGIRRGSTANASLGSVAGFGRGFGLGRVVRHSAERLHVESSSEIKRGEPRRVLRLCCGALRDDGNGLFHRRRFLKTRPRSTTLHAASEYGALGRQDVEAFLSRYRCLL
jgi:hypothetical protein